MFSGTITFRCVPLYKKILMFQVTGHSLGASMASLAASYVIATEHINGSNVKLITYGQPRTGNRAFATAHNKQACQNNF